MNRSLRSVGLATIGLVLVGCSGSGEASSVGLIAVGHSGLTGEGTGGTYEAVTAKSWATGTDPLVNSVYLRMVALLSGH